MVKSGTVASKTAATAESMDFSPHEIRKNGMATVVMPNTRTGIQLLTSRGSFGHWTRMTAIPNRSPNRTRKATSVIGPISWTAILIHKKEELQIPPSRMNTNQCLSCKRFSSHTSIPILIAFSALEQTSTRNEFLIVSLLDVYARLVGYSGLVGRD